MAGPHRAVPGRGVRRLRPHSKPGRRGRGGQQYRLGAAGKPAGRGGGRSGSGADPDAGDPGQPGGPGGRAADEAAGRGGRLVRGRRLARAVYHAPPRVRPCRVPDRRHAGPPPDPAGRFGQPPRAGRCAGVVRPLEQAAAGAHGAGAATRRSDRPVRACPLPPAVDPRAGSAVEDPHAR